MGREQQNITLAELEGFKRDPDAPRGTDGSIPWRHPVPGDFLLVYDEWKLPDYFGDLNAMARIERIIRIKGLGPEYRNNLIEVVGGRVENSIHAEAFQRAEAAVKTI